MSHRAQQRAELFEKVRVLHVALEMYLRHVVYSPSQDEGSEVGEHNKR